MLGFVVTVLAAYLLGAANGSLLIGRLRGVDIRTLGSGNAGGTNALRTQGPAFALGVVVIDVLKGWVAVALLPALAALLDGSTPSPGSPAGPAAALPAACGFAAIVGHVYPVYYGFRGGKGAATLVGALLALSPLVTLWVSLIWFVMVVLLGYVGLATVVASIAVPVLIAVERLAPQAPLLTFGIAVAALVTFTHRSNLARLRAGTEPRARRLWLFGRGSRSQP